MIKKSFLLNDPNNENSMEIIKQQKYIISADSYYDYLGENVRDDFEELIELSDKELMVKINVLHEEQHKEYVYHVPIGTPYDYIGENMRDELEEKFGVNMEVTITVY